MGQIMLLFYIVELIGKDDRFYRLLHDFKIEGKSIMGWFDFWDKYTTGKIEKYPLGVRVK